MPKRGVVRFGKRGKLSPRFIGPFKILERIGTIAYRLALPPSMSGVHEVFLTGRKRGVCKCTPMCASARVASSNIMISEYRSHGELGY